MRLAALTLLLSASVGAPARADHPRCGGVAPAISRCEVPITHLAEGAYPHLWGYRSFTGTITATLETATGTWTYGCYFNVLLGPGNDPCFRSKTGSPSAPGKLVGTGAGIGPWVVVVADAECSGSLERLPDFVHCYGPI